MQYSGKMTMNISSGLGSRVDAPQKPNCRSLVQGLERQGLRRHLPTRSSVRAELRDGDSSVATEMWFCMRLEEEGGEQGSHNWLFRGRACEEFNSQLKCPRLVSAKINTTMPRLARSPPACLATPTARAARTRGTPFSFLNFSI
jgi:hypothetical protein